MVNANGNQGGNTTESNVEATVRSAESSPVSGSNKAPMEFTNFEDLWNRNYPSAYSAARRSLRPASGTSAALDNSSQSAPSNANGVSQTAPLNDTASSNRDYFSNVSDSQRQMVSYGLNDEYKRRNAGQEKYEWASDVTVTPKSNKNGNRVNYSEISQYKVPYIGSQYIPPSNDFTPVKYTIPTFEGNPADYPMQPNYENVLEKGVVNRYKKSFDDLAEYAPIDGGYNNNYASVYQYGSQVDPERINKIRSKEPIYYDNRGEVWPIDNFLPRNKIGYPISNGLQNQSPYYQIGGIVEMAPGYYREYELADKMYNDHIKKHRDEIRRQYIPHYVPNYNASDYDWLINQANKLLEAEKEKNFFNQLRYDPNIQLKKMDRLSIEPPLDFIPPYTYMCGGSSKRR